MTPDLENAEERIDRDKRRREAEIAFLLLGLYALSLRRIEDALRTGGDPYAMLWGVLFGNPALNMRGGTLRLAGILRGADLDGFQRTRLILPTEGTRAPADYGSLASQSLARNLGTLQQAVGGALAKGGGLTKTVQAVREAFAKGGFVKRDEFPQYKAWRSRTTAETLVGTAYNNGYGAGLASMVDRLTGFRYSAVRDKRTTAICTAYDGVMLPPDSFWWQTHWPMNHFSCRATVLPVFTKFTPTADPPFSPPPMSGFGIAPVSFAGFTFRRDAA